MAPSSKNEPRGAGSAVGQAFMKAGNEVLNHRWVLEFQNVEW
jgi:hypothetical protein